MAGVTIAGIYREFAAREARGVSPTYERLADAVASDEEILGLLGELPAAKRQPNLLLAVVRLLDGPMDGSFRDFVVENWAAIAPEMQQRATQTNEIGRCAALLPVLAALPQPLALIDVGASAGLLLYPDKYSYRYGSHLVGSSPPVLDCQATGLNPPATRPTVAWRAGVDLNPLDITDPADVAWLEAHWISVEGPEVIDFGSLPAPPDASAHNVLALDGRPLAWVKPHGQALTWF